MTSSFRATFLAALCSLLALALLFGVRPAYAVQFNAPVVRLSPSAPVSLAGHLELLSDPDGRLNLADVLGPGQADRFRPLSGFLNRGYTKEASWLRFSLSRSGSSLHDWMLRLGPSMLDEIKVYVQTGDDPSVASSYREYVFGDHHPIDLRPVRHSSFALPLLLPDDRPRHVYLRVQTTSSHNLAGWLYSLDQFVYWSEIQALLTGGFFGICLLVTCINIIYSIKLRDLVYGYYACYVFALAVSYLAVTGVLPLLLPSAAHLVCDYLTGGGVALSFSFFALFATRLLETRGRGGFAHRYFQFTVLFGVACCLSIPLHLYVRVAPLLVLNGILFVIYLVWKGVDLLRKQVPAGSLFLIAFMTSNVGALLALFRMFGLAPFNWFTAYGMQIGAVLSMVLMTLALTRRVHAAEEKALASSRETEQRAVDLAKEMTSELVRKRTELEEALETEREALQSQARFVDMISHEYRTPLAIIRANLDILEMKAGSNPELTRNFGKMRRAVARLVEVLEISLGRERMDEAIKKASRELIHLAPFVESMMEEMRELWGEGRLVLELGEVEGSLTGDSLLLKTAFLNLVDNALKYSPESAPVVLSLERDGQEALVAVRDSGQGIVREELERVFEKYYRGSGSRDTRGAGVGLHLVKKIIEQHGGRVTLENSPQGGTLAMVRLPLNQSKE
ncbi:sensor histidine kinase [Geomonas sp.]|uniref:sensor histidine kinase n=1 Tax=Geomonas sp. TaxID=2651584 RepID=UPI002B48D3D6|nr:sensor histidine kinase [Geomonas sp.]HJV34508.1 sensor histidine kinase [Geomonas sp.]